MGSAFAFRTARAAESRAPPDAALNDLVDQLVKCANRRQGKHRRKDAASTMAAATQETSAPILDVEVNGIRCVLTRAMPVAVGAPVAQPRRESVILSPREQEIARMVMKGYPNKTIAAVLDISVWTVGTHLRRIFAKLGVGTRAAMVANVLECDNDKPVGRP